MSRRPRPGAQDLRDETGAVMVLVAACLSVLVLLAAFVVDIGNWFEHKRHLQTQVDAAALAGAGRWQACFGGGGYQLVFAEATDYVGAPASYGAEAYTEHQYNAQVGGTSGNVRVLYQSPTWANGTVDPDPPLPVDPCTAPYVLDVKASEMPPPFFFPFVGRLFDASSAINARARVQLFSMGAAEPSLPLAVPDVNPKQVGVTFVDERTQTELAGCSSTDPAVKAILGTTCSFFLTKGDVVAGLTQWSAATSVKVPPGSSSIGVRVGIGTTVGSCAGVTGGAGYACYDYPGLWRGLVMIRGYDPSAAAFPTSPQLRQARATVDCAGSPFFSDAQLGGLVPCDARVYADVDFGAGAVQALEGVTATVSPVTSGGAQSAPMTLVGGTWQTAPGAFSIPVGRGPYDVTIDWKYDKAKGSFNGGKAVQRLYSASDDGSGPLKALLLSDYSLTAGDSHAVAVSLQLKGTLQVATPCPPASAGQGASYDCPTDRPVRLRFASDSGSQNYAINCGTVPGHTGGDFYQQLRYGCANWYSINAPQVCPDPANPSAYPDCVPIGNFVGDKVGQLAQAMNDRFAPGGVCKANTYPSIATGDPRVVILIVTNFDEFGGSGGKVEVPVVTYAAFYVTGWYGAVDACTATNEPPPGGTASKGDVWGHFVKYVVLEGRPDPNVQCQPDVNPCIPQLTK